MKISLLIHISLSIFSETFWVDLVLRNPLDVDVSLSALTLSVREVSIEQSTSAPDFLEVESVDDIVLGPRDTRTVRTSHHG